MILYHPINAPEGREFPKEQGEALLALQETKPSGWTDNPIKRKSKVKNIARPDTSAGDTGETT